MRDAPGSADGPLWSAVFAEIRPWVFEVAMGFQEAVDVTTSELAAATVRSERLMAGDTVALAILDGGVIFHTYEGARDEESRDEAFREWVDEREAAGEEWDEDEFEYEPADDDFDGLADGVYVVGRHCMRLISARLSAAPQPDAGPNEPTVDRLNHLASQQRTVMADSVAQAHVLIDRSLGCEWDDLPVEIGPWKESG